MSDRVQAPFGRRAATVTHATRVGAYTVLGCADPDGPGPAAGQFYMLSTEHRWGGGQDERPFLPRAFSVLRLAGEDELEFLLEDVGPGTQRLCELRAGEQLWLVGPLGSPFPPPLDGEQPLLVGGGVGIAPLAILSDQLHAGWAQRGPARVALGFRDAAHAAAATLIPGAEVATDDGSAGHRGLVTDLLRAALDTEAPAHVYACGPAPMLEAVRAICRSRDLAAHLALEAGMACGYGACFGCVVPTRMGYLRLCVDGPVLDAAVLERVG